MSYSSGSCLPYYCYLIWFSLLLTERWSKGKEGQTEESCLATDLFCGQTTNGPARPEFFVD